MKFVFSLKRSSYKDNESLEAVKRALTSGEPPVVKAFLPSEQAEMDKYVTEMVGRGYVCHTADHVDTFMTQNTIVSIKKAA